MFEFKLEDFTYLKELFISKGIEDFHLRKTLNKVEGFSYDTEAEIMIRVNKDFLTIARINVLDTRKGTGFKILSFLINYCKNNNKNKLIIESAFTDEMINFCNKHGFKPDMFAFTNKDGKILGNYELYL